MKIGLRIEKNPVRAPAGVVEKFKGLPTGHVVDAVGRFTAMHHSIKPAVPGFAAVGSALTVRVWPGDNLIVNKAVTLARPGDVLVIDNGQFEGAAVWGDLVSGMAKNAGAAGMVTNGLVRDIAGIAEAGFPVFARGSACNAGFKRGPGEIGFPVACGGVSVKNGDIIVADVDGVVVVPLEMAEDVLANLPAVLEGERKAIEKIRAGAIAPDDLDQAMRDAGYAVE